MFEKAKEVTKQKRPNNGHECDQTTTEQYRKICDILCSVICGRCVVVLWVIVLSFLGRFCPTVVACRASQRKPEYNQEHDQKTTKHDRRPDVPLLGIIFASFILVLFLSFPVVFGRFLFVSGRRSHPWAYFESTGR